jgi:putative transport protein
MGVVFAERTKRSLRRAIAVADAICYIFGTLGVIWRCVGLRPKLLRFDLRAESKKVEASLGIGPSSSYFVESDCET